MGNSVKKPVEIQNASTGKKKVVYQNWPTWYDCLRHLANSQAVSSAQVLQYQLTHPFSPPMQYYTLRAMDEELRSKEVQQLLGGPDVAILFFEYLYNAHSGDVVKELEARTWNVDYIKNALAKHGYKTEKERENVLETIRQRVNARANANIARYAADAQGIFGPYNQHRQAQLETDVHHGGRKRHGHTPQKQTVNTIQNNPLPVYPGGIVNAKSGEESISLKSGEKSISAQSGGKSISAQSTELSHTAKISGFADYIDSIDFDGGGYYDGQGSTGRFDGNHDDMDMLEFGDGDRAARYAGYGQAGHYHDNRAERNRLYRSGRTDRNLYHRRGLQEIASFESNGFGVYLDSLPMILLFVFLMAVICIFGIVFHHRYKKNKAKKNDEYKMVVIQAKNNEEDEV